MIETGIKLNLEQKQIVAQLREAALVSVIKLIRMANEKHPADEIEAEFQKDKSEQAKIIQALIDSLADPGIKTFDDFTSCRTEVRGGDLYLVKGFKSPETFTVTGRAKDLLVHLRNNMAQSLNDEVELTDHFSVLMAACETEEDLEEVSEEFRSTVLASRSIHQKEAFKTLNEIVKLGIHPKLNSLEALMRCNLDYNWVEDGYVILTILNEEDHKNQIYLETLETWEVTGLKPN